MNPGTATRGSGELTPTRFHPGSSARIRALAGVQWMSTRASVPEGNPVSLATISTSLPAVSPRAAAVRLPDHVVGVASICMLLMTVTGTPEGRILAVTVRRLPVGGQPYAMPSMLTVLPATSPGSGAVIPMSPGRVASLEYSSVKVVPKPDVTCWVLFGRYRRTLPAGPPVASIVNEPGFTSSMWNGTEDPVMTEVPSVRLNCTSPGHGAPSRVATTYTDPGPRARKVAATVLLAFMVMVAGFVEPVRSPDQPVKV